MNLVEAMIKAHDRGAHRITRNNREWSACFLTVDEEGDLDLGDTHDVEYLSKEDLLADDWFVE